MYLPAPIAAHHELDTFQSGVLSLDTWLRDSALETATRGLSRTFVWTEEGGDKVVAYYTLTAHSLQRESLIKKLGRGNPAFIPAILLARLALDVTLHGTGLGGVLLADAAARAVRASREIGAKFLVVDAIDDKAATFYAHHGFVPACPDVPLRLAQKLADIAASITD